LETLSTLVESSGQDHRRAYWITLAAVLAVLLALLWFPEYNTFLDFPFHLARTWALHVYDGTPFFRDVLIRAIEPIPNLAIDLLVPPLLNFLPPLVAGKVFLSLIVILFAAGCHALATTIHGRPSWMVPIAAFMAFNSPFLAGFVNSAFSLSLFLVALAVWLRVSRHWTVSGWLMITCLATLVYLSHLSGFVFLGASVGICVLVEVLRRRPFRIRAADVFAFSIFLPAVAIQLYPWANRLKTDSPVVWGNLSEKLLGLGAVFLGFRYDVDAFAVLLLAAAAGVALIKGKVRFEPLLFSLACFFFAASFICPNELGGSSGVDNRFSPAAFVFLFLSFRATLPKKTAYIVMSLALTAQLIRMGDIGWHLNRTSAAAARMIPALEQAAPNSRIYTLFLRPDDIKAEKQLRGNVHLASYSLILTQSISSDYFALRGVQPLYFRNPSEWVVKHGRWTFDPAFLDANLRTYDYVWGCNLDPTHIAYLKDRATIVSTGDICGLWKLKR
jgi:hypothetical protein